MMGKSLLEIFSELGAEVSTITTPSILPSNPDRPLIPTNFGKQIVDYLELDIEKGPWLAGGAVRKFYLNESIENSDWDIWFNSPDQYQKAYQKMKELKASVAFETDNAISFKYYPENEPAQTIQLIRRKFYDNPYEIIGGFDFSVCQLATDGHKIIASDYAIRDIKSRTLRLTQDHIPQYIVPRIVKYMVYGYRPNIDLLEKIEENKTTIDWLKEVNDYDAV